MLVSALGIKEEEDRWVLERERQYYLIVRIHDNEGHEVHLSQVVLHSYQFMLHCIFSHDRSKTFQHSSEIVHPEMKDIVIVFLVLFKKY